VSSVSSVYASGFGFKSDSFITEWNIRLLLWRDQLKQKIHKNYSHFDKKWKPQLYFRPWKKLKKVTTCYCLYLREVKKPSVHVVVSNIDVSNIVRIMCLFLSQFAIT